jgi:Flp pilus assembly protein TadG
MDHAADYHVSALDRKSGCGLFAPSAQHSRRDNKWIGALSRGAEIVRQVFERRAAGNAERVSSGLVRTLAASRAGAALVEFALVGPMFLLLTFAIVDNGLVLFTQSVLDNATREAARQIRLGKVQTAGNDSSGAGLFSTTLCANLGGFVPCPSAKLTYSVQSSTVGFSSITSTITTNTTTGIMTSAGFTPGGPQAYVLVQVGYAQPYIMALLDRITGAKANITLLSTVAFQTEHYQ